MFILSEKNKKYKKMYFLITITLGRSWIQFFLSFLFKNNSILKIYKGAGIKKNPKPFQIKVPNIKKLYGRSKFKK